jgi:hypothetical protein
MEVSFIEVVNILTVLLILNGKRNYGVGVERTQFFIQSSTGSTLTVHLFHFWSAMEEADVTADIKRFTLEELVDKEYTFSKLLKAITARINNGDIHIGKKQIRTQFSAVMEDLKESGLVGLEEDLVVLLKKGKRKLEKLSEEVVSSHAKMKKEDNDGNGVGIINKSNITKELWKTGEIAWRDGLLDSSYLSSNPDRITRLFCGNLNKNITEDELKSAIPGIMYIKWITDKQTREFYGSTFLEMSDPTCAALAVGMDKSKLKGRPLKIYYCPPRPGDVWPPVGGGSGRGRDLPGSNGPPRRERTAKPEGGRKLFIGNLSYNIDDEAIIDFFKDCGELTGLRWMTRQDTDEFRVSITETVILIVYFTLFYVLGMWVR